MRKLHGPWRCLRRFVTSSVHRQNASVGKTNGLVTVEKFKTVTILSINRPSKQNAMNEVLLHELASCLTQFEKDDNASVVVINGIGGNFSVGYDIDELRQTCQYDANAVRNSILFPFRRKSGKPFLCSISGQCKSIGFEIALMCDIRFVEEKTVLGFSNRKLGIPLLNGGPQRLAGCIGVPKAMEFLIMDREMNANEAVNLGIAKGMVQDGTALGSAMKTAVHLSSLPQSALHYDLNAVNRFDFDQLYDTNRWKPILNDIKSNIHLNEETLKTARIFKLNNMSQWELDEIEYERKYDETLKQSEDK